MEAGVNTLYVALGGAIGGTARYVIDTSILGSAGNPNFPLGMFIVNITGAFLTAGCTIIELPPPSMHASYREDLLRHG